MPDYLIRKIEKALPDDNTIFDAPEWDTAQAVRLEHTYYEESPGRVNDFAAEVTVRLLHNNDAIYGFYDVQDRYVRVVRTGYQQPVCKDSCVEFFVRPAECERYFNFEFSGGGAMLLFDALRVRAGVYDKVPDADCATVKRYHTLPERVDPEITEPVRWKFAFAIPAAFFAKFAQQYKAPLSGQTWHANFTKCCDETSHPHWISWQSLPVLDFHQPDRFGTIEFE